MNDNHPKSSSLVLQKIYLKDVSLETPMGFKAFQQAWKPRISQQLQTRHQASENGLHEVILTTTLTAQLGEAGKEETAFIVEVQQAGLFKLQAADENTEKQLVNVACPTILFPYVREAVDNLLVKAGFPAVNMPAINFEALYQQALQQQSLQEKAATSAH
jgi:preprotein translocase subunit SecB